MTGEFEKNNEISINSLKITDAEKYLDI